MNRKVRFRPVADIVHRSYPGFSWGETGGHDGLKIETGCIRGAVYRSGFR